jgi:hypothetical protein
MTNPSDQTPPATPSGRKKMSPGQQSYEERRAKQAGHTLDQWIDVKGREKRAAERRAAYVPKRPGLLKKIIGWIAKLQDRKLRR